MPTHRLVSPGNDQCSQLPSVFLRNPNLFGDQILVNTAPENASNNKDEHQEAQQQEPPPSSASQQAPQNVIYSPTPAVAGLSLDEWMSRRGVLIQSGPLSEACLGGVRDFHQFSDSLGRYGDLDALEYALRHVADQMRVSLRHQVCVCDHFWRLMVFMCACAAPLLDRE